jgi:hypothetical protein
MRLFHFLSVLCALCGSIETAWARPPEPIDDSSAARRAPEPMAEAAGAAVDPNKVSFRRDIAPLLVKNCVACHGPEKAESGYRVDTFERAKKPGDIGSPPFTPGKIDESEWVRLMTSSEMEERMPKEADPLPAGQIDLVKRWIADGAPFDGPDAAAPLASYLPRASHPNPPDVYPAPVPITALAFNPDGGELAVGGYHEVTIHSAADGKLLRRIKNVPQRTHALAYTPDGVTLAIGGGTPGRLGEVKLVNAADGAERRLLMTTSDEVFDLALSPDGNRLAIAAADRAIRIFKLADGGLERTIENHADWVMAIAFSPDGARLASASRDKTAKLFEVATGQLLATYSAHAETVYGVAFSADGQFVFSAGRDNRIRQWKSSDAANAGEISFGGEVYKIVASGDFLFAPSADKTVRQFKRADRAAVRSYDGQADWVYAAAYHSGTKRLAAGGYDGRVMIWNVENGKPVSQFVAAPGYAR